MKCPFCKEDNCRMIKEFTRKGGEFNKSRAFWGFIILGPVGLLCGKCGNKKEIVNTNYWFCNNCGKKGKA